MTNVDATKYDVSEYSWTTLNDSSLVLVKLYYGNIVKGYVQLTKFSYVYRSLESYSVLLCHLTLEPVKMYSGSQLLKSYLLF